MRDWATTALAGDWAGRPLLVCGDLNDTMDAATTQLVFGPPGSQIGTGGFNHPEHGDPQRLRPAVWPPVALFGQQPRLGTAHRAAGPTSRESGDGYRDQALKLGSRCLCRRCNSGRLAWLA